MNARDEKDESVSGIVITDVISSETVVASSDSMIIYIKAPNTGSILNTSNY
jgi:hypothetical protein